MHEPLWSVPSSWFHCRGAKKQFHIYFGNLKPEDPHHTLLRLKRGRDALPCITICLRISSAYALRVSWPACILATVISPDSSKVQSPSTCLRCRRSDIKSVRGTNVYAAVAHSCRSVRPTLSLSLAARHNAGAE